MAFLTQSRYPILWKIFQYCIGGTVDKRKLAVCKYEKQGNILEVGCSLGNIAKVFLKKPDLKYTGLDIDPVAIRCAQKDYANNKNFRFICMDLGSFIKQSDEKFDYILFAGMLHHVDLGTFRDLFKDVRPSMPDDGVLVVVDRLSPRKNDNWFIHVFKKLERGEYVRDESEMQSILKDLPGFKLRSVETCLIGATPLSIPKCARFGVYVLSKIPY